eukprot:2296666-Alexandrium_andersonii.AAC.1
MLRKGRRSNPQRAKPERPGLRALDRSRPGAALCAAPGPRAAARLAGALWAAFPASHGRTGRPACRAP